jgi:hypothetical protein
MYQGFPTVFAPPNKLTQPLPEAKMSKAARERTITMMPCFCH